MLTESTLVREARDLVSFDPLAVSEEDSALDVLRRFAAHPAVRVVYVVDRLQRLRGVIPASTVEGDALAVPSGAEVDADFDQDQENFPERAAGPTAGDIMQPAVSVTLDEPLVDALSKMYENDVEEIAVVEADGHLVGNLNAVEVLAVWAHRA